MRRRARRLVALRARRVRLAGSGTAKVMVAGVRVPPLKIWYWTVRSLVIWAGVRPGARMAPKSKLSLKPGELGKAPANRLGSSVTPVLFLKSVLAPAGFSLAVSDSSVTAVMKLGAFDADGGGGARGH